MRGPLEVRCPTCGRPAGEPCVSVHAGNLCRKPHRQRTNRATVNREIKRAAKRQRRSRPRMPQAVVDAVLDRAAGRCEAADLWPTLTCSGRIQLHHVLRRSQGGTDIVENIKALCSTHHAAVHAWPQMSYRLGLLRARHGRRVA